MDCGIATDDIEDLKTKLERAFEVGDVIVTTGGVSMGDRDLIRQVLVQVRKRILKLTFFNLLVC